jgi:Tol biopolymer transport system component
MIKSQFPVLSIVFVLMISSCSIEVDQPVQPTQTAGADAVPAASPTSVFPTTQIPVAWGHLNLTGKLIYLSSTRENDIVTGTMQMLDLVTGEIATILSIPRGWVYYASISPDAQSIVMSYAPPAQPDSSPARILYIMPLDASIPPRPLFTPPTADDRYIQVEWSPDGSYIYFVHYGMEFQNTGQLDPDYDIQRMRYPDGQIEKIADNAFWPRLSSDSSKLAYIFVDPDSRETRLFVANANGSNPLQVPLSGPASQEIIDAPIFSPDGQSILFSVPSLGQSYQRNWFEKLVGLQVAKAHNVPSDWWSVPVTGGEPTQLTNIQSVNLFASISPEQQYIASLSGEGLFVMNWDGSNLTQLVSDPGVHGTVTWIP